MVLRECKKMTVFERSINICDQFGFRILSDLFLNNFELFFRS